MAKIIRDGGYIRAKRRKAVKHAFFWITLMLTVFFAGLIFNGGSRASIFTVIAAVISLPAAQNLVAVVAYFKNAKSFPETEKKLLSLPDSCSVFINNIAVSGNSTVLLNYIIASDFGVYILADFNAVGGGAIDSIKKMWLQKGIDLTIAAFDVHEWDEAIDDAKNKADCGIDEFYISAIKRVLL